MMQKRYAIAAVMAVLAIGSGVAVGQDAAQHAGGIRLGASVNDQPGIGARTIIATGTIARVAPYRKAVRGTLRLTRNGRQVSAVPLVLARGVRSVTGSTTAPCVPRRRGPFTVFDAFVTVNFEGTPLLQFAPTKVRVRCR